MRVAIAGAGAFGRSIAQALLGDGHKVLLIERRRDRYRPDLVPEADWMMADACEINTAQRAGIDTCDVVVAATGDDKANLVFALLAKTEFGVARVVARVNNPDDQWLFTAAWGVDVAVSTPDALLTVVEQTLTEGDLVRLIALQHSYGTVVEVKMPADGPLVGRLLRELVVPDGAAVLGILREGELLAPQPQARLRDADELVLLTSAAAEEQLRALIKAAPAEQ